MTGTARSTVAAIALTVLDAATVPAQSDELQLNARINYVYATQFGFGQYSIGGLDVGVYSLPLEVGFENVVGEADLRLGFPITYGHYHFRGSTTAGDVGASADLDSNSLAVQPKLTLDIPLAEGLYLSPLIAWGAGFTFGTGGDIVVGGAEQTVDDSEVGIYTYEVGVSGLYERSAGDFRLLYGMAYVWAGDDTFDGGNSEAYGTFYTGPEVRHPLGFRLGDVTPEGGLFFVYHYFTPDLRFTRADREDLQVQQIFEFGFSVGSSTPMHLPVVDDMLDRFRIGFSYQTAPGFDGFRLNFGFPF